MKLKKVQFLLCSAILSFNISILGNSTASTIQPSNAENVENVETKQQSPNNSLGEPNETEETDTSENLIQLFCILDDPY